VIQNTPDTLVVNELFYSIQGESSYAGLPCVFVRLTYCNLRCTYCDSEYTFEEGEPLSIDEIVSRVREYQCPLVEVTGGEPLFQSNTPQLLKRLCDEGFTVLLETGGSLPLTQVDQRVTSIVDFKCPSSGMEKKNLWSIAVELKQKDEVKFVIGNREDYDWAKDKITRYSLVTRCSVLLSVVFGKLEPVRLAEWILDDRLPVRFQLQQHKMIWDPGKRGV